MPPSNKNELKLPSNKNMLPGNKGKSTIPSSKDKSVWNKGPRRTKRILFAMQKMFVISFVLQVRTVLSNRFKLQSRRLPALEQDKFLSSVKKVRFYNLQVLI